MKNSFNFVKKINDPRFGEISIYKSKTQNEVIFLKSQNISNKQELDQVIHMHQIRINLNHPSLLNLIDYEYEQIKSLCSTSYLFNAIYVYPKTDTLRESEILKKKNQKFSGDELEKIAG